MSLELLMNENVAWVLAWLVVILITLSPSFFEKK